MHRLLRLPSPLVDLTIEPSLHRPAGVIFTACRPQTGFHHERGVGFHHERGVDHEQ